MAAVPFDVGRLAVTGPAVNVLEGVVVRSGGATQLAVSSTGTLAYVEGLSTSQLVLVDHDGVERALLGPGNTRRRFMRPRISPTGAHVAVLVSDGFAMPEIWIYTVASRTLSRFTTDGPGTEPRWTHDGRRLTWRSLDRSTLMWQAWDGSGRAETLADSSLNAFGATFARSGEFFVSEVRRGSTAADIVLVPLRGDRTPRVLVATPEIDVEPSISPDGRWLAYMSGRASRFEVYVQRTSGVGGRHQISTDLGSLPVWSPDGRTLYYRSSDHVIAARLVLEPQFQVTARDTLFRSAYLGGPSTMFEITPDGRYFLMLKSGDEQSRAVVVLGWLDELRERMATAEGR